MGFFRQEYWSELPFSPPGDLPDPRIKTVYYISCTIDGFFFFFTTEPLGKPMNGRVIYKFERLENYPTALAGLCLRDAKTGTS